MTDQNGQGRELATMSAKHAPIARALDLDKDRMVLLSNTLGADLNRDELHLFLAVAARLGLDPFTRQIHAVKDKKNGRFFVHVGIDGRRAIAQRTGMVDGTNGPYWCGSDGEWREVWLNPEPPAAAMFEVFKKGCAKPFRGVASLKSFRGVGPNWNDRADHQLAKVAEDHAWRKAFPFEMGGLPSYAPEHDATTGSDDEPLPDGAVDGEYRHVDQETGEVTAQGGGSSAVEHQPTPTRAANGRQEGPGFESSSPPENEPEKDDLDRTLEEHAAKTAEQGQPAWFGTPLGKKVLEMADQITELGGKVSLPDDDADDATLQGWLSSKAPILKARQGAR